jgi:hypothetical protein
MTMFYLNKKNNKIEVSISYHAKIRFIERYNKIFINRPICEIENIENIIEKLWKRSKKLVRKTKYIKERKEKHGKDTLYFICDCFMFVVQNSVIVTIEIGSKNMRHLNNNKNEHSSILNKINTLNIEN